MLLKPIRNINTRLIVEEWENLQRIFVSLALKLHRAVSYANFGKLRFKTEYEQHLWGKCSRLLTNCIIAYNTTLLSHLLADKERLGDVPGAAALQQISPVAWQHINLYGRYEFRKGPEAIKGTAVPAARCPPPVLHSRAGPLCAA
jgi:hypothetical protein